MQTGRPDYQFQDHTGEIPDHEPVFVVRGQDIAGPGTVEAWANLNEIVGGDPRLTAMARQHAEVMREWQRANGCRPATGPRDGADE